MITYTNLVPTERENSEDFNSRICFNVRQGMFEQLRVEDSPISPIVAKIHREDVRANQNAVFLPRAALIGQNAALLYDVGFCALR